MKETLQRLSSRVDLLLESALTNLRTLTGINSFTWNREGIDANAEVITSLFEPLGFAPRRIESNDPCKAAHLLLERRGYSPANVLLVSHLDTVYSPEEEQRRAFHWREEGELIHAPGIVDVKGGTVLVHLALSALAAEMPQAFEPLSLKLLLNAAEETGSEDFPQLLAEAADDHTLACLIFEHGSVRENGGSAITVGRRGSARFRIDAHGRAAHSGSGHHRGANAVHALALLVVAVEQMSDPALNLTFNVGHFEGGSVVNTVPAHASCLVDMRADDPEVFADGIRRVLALAGESPVRARNDAHACRIEVTRLPDYPPWPGNDRSDALAALFCEVGEELGQTITPEYRLGASDGCHIWQHVPTLDGLGPLGGAIHCAVHDPAAGKKQEYLRRSSLAPRALLTAATLLRLIEQGIP